MSQNPSPETIETNPFDRARRRALLVLGTIGASAAAAGFTRRETAAAPRPACTFSPELTEGPFFVDRKLMRADLRAGGKDAATVRGTPLALNLQLVDASGGCAPVAGARVDVWHANADGVYSAEPGQAMQARDTSDENFFRGYQLSNAQGRVRFVTVFPGGYPGRAVHVHFKVRRYLGERKVYEYTSQLFFDDETAERVFAAGPYPSRERRGIANRDDGIFDPRLVVPLEKSAALNGYEGEIAIGLMGMSA